jgi:phosphate transport system substrate-binding protein
MQRRFSVGSITVNKPVLSRLFGAILMCVCVFAIAQAPAADQPAAPKKAAPKAAAPKAAAAKAAPKAAAQPPIVVRGDHTTARVVKDLVKHYEATKQGKVEVQPFSTVSGLDAVGAGTVDVAATARTAMPDRVEEKGINFFPLGWDALVVITSAKNPVNNITLKQMHDIYLGRVTDWKDLGGAAAEINLVGVAGPLDGVEYSTRLLLFHDGDQAVSIPRVYVNTEKLEEAIAIDPHGIGMSTLSGVAGNPQIKMLSVEGVAPSIATITDGSYPLYSPLYLAARDDGRNNEAVKKFVAFADSESGRAILRKHYLVPFADVPDLMNKQEARIAFVDAHARPELVASSMGTRPVSAPNATADMLTRTAPTSEEAVQAKARAAKISAEKNDKKAAPVTPDGGN